jgi:hypothetical protein
MLLKSAMNVGKSIHLKPKAIMSTLVKILTTVSFNKLVNTPFLNPQAKPSSHKYINKKKVKG